MALDELTGRNRRARQRLPHELLNKVRPEHVHRAVRTLLEANRPHEFGPSTDYDLLTEDGHRLPPKAVFGLAATEALGFEVLPRHFTAGLVTPSFKILRSAGYQIVPKLGPEDGATKRNPNWSREETILALELYARRRPQLPGEQDGQVVELSNLLRAYADQRGVRGTATFRNANGVSMKIANLSSMEDPNGRAGLRSRAEMDERVWAEFMPDVNRLHEAAASIRAAIAQSVGAVEVMAQAELDRQAPSQGLAASRGPAPTAGIVTYEKQDGVTSVYVMKLVGAVRRVFPAHNLVGRAIVKVGLTNDTTRRLQELNSGFPPGADLRWTIAYVQRFPTSEAAYAAEQAILARLANDRKTLGGEFALVAEKELPLLLAGQR